MGNPASSVKHVIYIQFDNNLLAQVRELAG
jgi:hypothetical protein